VAAQERAAKDAAKKAAKAEAAEQKQADKLANSMVTIKRIERNKRKYVTAVSGLEAFGLELKKVRSLTLLMLGVWLGCLLFADGYCVKKTGVQGLWQEIRDWVVGDQDAERRGGDRSAGRCERGD
jgi:hypothetical protein